MDYGLALILGVKNLPDLRPHFTPNHIRQIGAAARLLDFTNRTGNTVDRWLFRLKHPGKVTETSFVSDLAIALLWALVAPFVALWVLGRAPRHRNASPTAA